jgi:dihydroorotase
MAELAGLGVRIFTDDGTGVQDSSVMRNAFAYAKGLGVILAQHCEDSSLSCGGHMHEGVWSSHLGVPGIPAAAEEVMVARDLILAKATGARIHFLHLSTAGSVELVRHAKADGVDVTAEVTPHHLSLTDGELAGYDPVFKVNPPLRSMTDVLAVRAGCVDGTIDAIATDHAPHPQEAKELPLDQAPPGLLGLQTALAVSAEALTRDDVPGGGLGIGDVIGLLSWKPARVAGLAVEQGGEQGGPLVSGNPANIFVFDPVAAWNVESSRLASRSTNSPWVGRKLVGSVRHTVFRGEPVVVDFEATR